MASPILVGFLLAVSVTTAALQYASAYISNKAKEGELRCILFSFGQGSQYLMLKFADELEILRAGLSEDCPDNEEDGVHSVNNDNSLQQPLLLVI